MEDEPSQALDSAQVWVQARARVCLSIESPIVLDLGLASQLRAQQFFFKNNNLHNGSLEERERDLSLNFFIYIKKNLPNPLYK